MTLHVFNPEHDIALATNQDKFTAPHAARRLRADFGFLPAFWAKDGDLVLVDDAEGAQEQVRHLKAYAADVQYVALADLANIDASSVTAIAPWGWDRTLCAQLLSANPSLAPLMPDSKVLEAQRQMSSRRFAAQHLLPQLTGLDSRLVGESTFCDDISMVQPLLDRHAHIVIKAPWSSSGRGLRYVDCEMSGHTQGWTKNIIAHQGGAMVEPFYQKVYDFGMEFCARPDGNIEYCGLSLFATIHGAYEGSMLATEADKREMLARYVDLTLLDAVKQRIIDVLQPLMRDTFTGPFGIDMMAVASPEPSAPMLLHPCVELNLRRTMGHVALALSPSPYEPHRLMRIYFSADRYKLRVLTTADNLLNTGLI